MLIRAEGFFAPGVGSTPGALPAFADAGADIDGATLAATHSTPAPATVAAGDFLLYAAIGKNDAEDAAVSSPPAEFTAFPGNPYDGATDANSRKTRLFLYWKDADGDEDGTTIDITMTGGSAGDQAQTKIWRFTAANGFNATPVQDIVSAQISGTTIPGPTIAAGGANELGVVVNALNLQDTMTQISGSTPDTWSEKTEDLAGTGTDSTLGLQTIDLSSGGGVSGGISTLGSGIDGGIQVAFRLVPALV